MRIYVSVGRAPKSATLEQSVYKLELTAETHGEKKWLAGLHKAVRLATRRIVSKKDVPLLVISEELRR